MPTRDDLKALVSREIDRRGAELIQIARTIGGHPEPGFQEHRTAALVADWFRTLGVSYREGLALTGVKGELTGGAPGPSIAIIGELDSLLVHDHPNADPETGAAHACGHHAQIAMMLATTVGLLAPDVLPALSGRIVPFAVPAEEYIQIEYRDDLRRQGRIEFLTGKAELIRLGEFDDVDMALITHTSSRPEDGRLILAGSSNGMVAKKIQFIGRAAHAGAAPWRGINALNAATLALQAIHAQRETFQDDDTVRIHPIITRGGEAVSAVPSDVRMETFVRGRTLEAIRDAAAKVDRAVKAGALAIGAQVLITTLPGYLPILNDDTLEEVYRPNAEALVGADDVTKAPHRTHSTDMGDLSQIMPVYHPNVRAATGIGHGNDYVIEDWELGVLTAAKAMAMTVIDLLADGAQGALRVKEAFQPALTPSDYLSLMRSYLGEELYTGEA